MRPDGSGAAAGGRTGRRPPGTERRGRAMAGPAMVATLCRSAARRPGVRGAGQPSVAGRRAGPAGASQRRRRRRARAPLLPRVDANYTLTREHLPKNYIYPPPTGGSVVSDNRLALDFSYELDFWGKNRARLQAAVSQRDAADADAQAARNLLARAIVRSYLNLQNAFAQREVLQRVLSQRAEVVDLTRGRKAAGLDTEVEVKQAESSLAAGRVELTRNETTIAQLRNQVAALAGAGPVRGQALAPVALTAPGGVIPASVPLELLGHRPDVTAARWAGHRRAPRHRGRQGRVLSQHQPGGLRRLRGAGHRPAARRRQPRRRHRPGHHAAHLPWRRTQRQPGGPPRRRRPGGLGLQPDGARRRAADRRCHRCAAPARPRAGRTAPGPRSHRRGL
ncbi:putative fusaric acid resistance protein FusA [Bordetella pertussis STO1-CHOC-0019]|nr:putative fusaric acid resistance protein FusA [Bordetella pertussis STO1-CHOC-0019]